MGVYPQQTESQLQRTIIDLLDVYEKQGLLTYLRVNSGNMVVQDGGRRRFIRLAPAGTSDLILFLNNGKTVFVELKTLKGKPTKQQLHFGEKVKRLKFQYFICRTMEQVHDIIKTYGR